MKKVIQWEEKAVGNRSSIAYCLWPVAFIQMTAEGQMTLQL